MTARDRHLPTGLRLPFRPLSFLKQCLITQPAPCPTCENLYFQMLEINRVLASPARTLRIQNPRNFISKFGTYREKSGQCHRIKAMRSSQAWILQSDNKKDFSYPDFSSHKSRACSSHGGISQRGLGTSPKLQYLSCRSRPT